MKIEFKNYKDSLLGCWWGKYAGGVIGMPFEGRRGVLDLDWYYQKDLKGIDNDDLDLQLVWLRACEKHGNAVDSQILAENWITYITGTPSEYGVAKTNLKMHISPPLSGTMNNVNKDSNGSFIRSEIWACICAGNPEIAVRYAVEDAMIDHGEEGVYGEVFFAAMQAEAFVEKDILKLIDLGLSYIPNDCGVARGIRCALECYHSGKTWKEARKAILQTVPGAFGMMGGYAYGMPPEEDVPVGKVGWDAPSNVSLAVMGLLYGEYDFQKTICICAGSMEDGDCTAGNAGSTLGIILGYEKLPKEMFEPLGEKIVTGCIKQDGDLVLPGTIDALVERILRLTPVFLGGSIVDTLSKEEGYTIEANVSGFPLLTFRAVHQYDEAHFSSVLERIPCGARYRNVLLDTTVFYERDANIRLGESKEITLRFYNLIWDHQHLLIRWIVPEGMEVENGVLSSLALTQKHGHDRHLKDYNSAKKTFKLTLTEVHSPIVELVVQITSVGRYTKTYIPITLVVD